MFGTTWGWVKYDRIKNFGLTIPLTPGCQAVTALQTVQCGTLRNYICSMDKDLV